MQKVRFYLEFLMKSFLKFKSEQFRNAIRTPPMKPINGYTNVHVFSTENFVSYYNYNSILIH